MIPKAVKDKYPELFSAIITGYRGSISHGTYIPDKELDDKDVMSVVIPNIDHYFGLNQYGHRGTKDVFEGEWDIVIYEFTKYIRLLIKSNPNVLALLWLPETLYITRTEVGQRLIDNRSIFVSKQAYHSFIGYAHGQLHRMTHMEKMKNLGEKRREIIKKFGYDTKNASHLIRLLRMGIEYLTEGQLYVQRKDAQQLLEIKQGEWTLEHVERESNRLFILAEEAYIRSSLPVAVNKDKVNKMCIEMIQDHFQGYTEL